MLVTRGTLVIQGLWAFRVDLDCGVQRGTRTLFNSPRKSKEREDDKDRTEKAG